MSYDSPDPTSDRTVHVYLYTDRILTDVRFADCSVTGKAMALGIALHEGQTGLWNVILNGLFCLAVVLLCVSGIVMWWMRRPAGAMRLAAPPLPHPVPPARGVMLIALLLSMAFPMPGLTFLALITIGLVILSALPGLKRAVS